MKKFVMDMEFLNQFPVLNGQLVIIADHFDVIDLIKDKDIQTLECKGVKNAKANEKRRIIMPSEFLQRMNL